MATGPRDSTQQTNDVRAPQRPLTTEVQLYESKALVKLKVYFNNNNNNNNGNL